MYIYRMPSCKPSWIASKLEHKKIQKLKAVNYDENISKACHSWFLFFSLISHYQSTAGGDLSMLFPLHAGFEPTLPRWLSAGWKGYYISYDTICICTVKVIHWISPLSCFTGHRHLLPIDFHIFYSHLFACTVSPTGGQLEPDIEWEGNQEFKDSRMCCSSTMKKWMRESITIIRSCMEFPHWTLHLPPMHSSIFAYTYWPTLIVYYVFTVRVIQRYNTIHQINTLNHR